MLLIAFIPLFALPFLFSFSRAYTIAKTEYS
jgi:hypothetical protein